MISILSEFSKIILIILLFLLLWGYFLNLRYKDISVILDVSESISITLEVLIGGFRVISFIILLYRFRVYFGDFENYYFVNKCFLVIYIYIYIKQIIG